MSNRLVPCVVRGVAFCVGRFQEQLKKLVPSGENPIAPALGKAFDLLGQHRLGTGVDTW